MNKISTSVIVICLFQLSFQRILRDSCGQVRYDPVGKQPVLPWVVKITDNQGNFISAGSLIQDDVVLTSNDIDREGYLDCAVVAASGERLGIRKVMVQEGDADDWHNNVALVFLERPIQLGTDVNTVCLLSGDVAGHCFGYNVTSPFDMVGEMVQVFDVSLLPEEQCDNILLENEIFGRPGSYMCTRAPADTKQDLISDWGTGLFCPLTEDIDDEEGRRFVQVGLFSWALEGQINPVGYTRIDFNAQWIKKSIVNDRKH